MADKKKLSYWERRNVNREEYLQRGIDPVQSKIAKAYLQAQKYLIDEVNKLFKRARLKTDMTEEELKKALNVAVTPNEILEYQRLAKQIETPEIAEQAKKQLNALAYKQRITRLEDLRAKTHLVAKQIANVEYQQQTNFYIDAIHDSYREAVAEDVIRKLEERGVEVETWNKSRNKVTIEVWNQADKHEFKELPTQATKNILESHWKGSNYSKRIWKDTDKLAQRLEELFTVESMTGMSDQEMSRKIAKEFQTSIGVANRLIRTEANYMAGQAKLKAWKDRGVEKYKLVVVLDLRTSDICQKKDKENKVYLVSEAIVNGAEGNYPPFHPFCRTIAIAYYGERTNKGYRTARDPISGEIFKLPRSATYDDWMNKLKEQYSDDEIALQKTKIKNIQKDNADYRRLKDVLGAKNSPKTLDEYQNIKYNDSNKWDELKKTYQNVKWMKNSFKNHSKTTEHKVPFENNPNSVIDKYLDDKIYQRRFYGKTGKPRLDIDFNQGNPKHHEIVPHSHEWTQHERNKEAFVRSPEWRELTEAEKIANKDVITDE